MWAAMPENGMAKNNDWLWGLLIIAGVVIFNLTRSATVTTSQVTTTEDGQPVAGAGVDPFDSSEYTTEALAVAGGLL